MKKFLSLLAAMTVILTISSVQANTYCHEPLTQDGNTIFLTCEKQPDGSYQIVIESDVELLGIGSTFCTVNGTAGYALNEQDHYYISEDGHRITCDIVSDSDPSIYTPLYILMPNEVNFGVINDIEWGSCEADIKESAIYFINSQGWQDLRAMLWVWSADNNDWVQSTTSITLTTDQVNGYEIYACTFPADEENVRIMIVDGMNTSEPSHRTTFLTPVAGFPYFCVNGLYDDSGYAKGYWYASLDDYLNGNIGFDPDAGTDTTPTAITVRLDPQSCPGWSTVSLWAWTSAGNVFEQWPGQTVSKDAGGWYSYTFASSIRSVNIIWNNGTDQTVDLLDITESTCFALDKTEGTEITVSTVNCPESTTPTVIFPTEEPLIWPIILDQTTAETNESYIAGDFRANGVDNNLYIWDSGNLYTSGDNEGKNFYGNLDGYLSLLVAAPNGWSGMGYCIENPASVSAMQNLQYAIVTDPDNYFLHIAIKATTEGNHQFYTFGTTQTSFAIGTATIENGPVIGDFPRDGEWHEFYIPMAQFANAIAGAEIKSGTNILCIMSGDQVGAQLNLDAVYFCNKYAMEHNIPAAQEITDPMAEDEEMSVEFTLEDFSTQVSEAPTTLSFEKDGVTITCSAATGNTRALICNEKSSIIITAEQKIKRIEFTFLSQNYSGGLEQVYQPDSIEWFGSLGSQAYITQVKVTVRKPIEESEPTVSIFGIDIPTDKVDEDGNIDIFDDQTLVYNVNDNMLTLSNLNLEVGEQEGAAISYTGTEPLTIVLSDASTILADTAIASLADVIITGEGTLSAEAVVPIVGAETATIFFEAVTMHVRSLPSPSAVRRRIRGVKQLDETGGPALSGFASAEFNKTTVTPPEAEYGEVEVEESPGVTTTINALYVKNANGTRSALSEFTLTAVKDEAGVGETKSTPATLDPKRPMYNILGVPVGVGYKGIIIQDGRKVFCTDLTD